MLAAKNLQKPITSASEGQHWIRILAAELALRLNNIRATNATLWPKTIVLHARQGRCCQQSSLILIRICIGYAASRSKQALFPFTQEVTVDTVASAGNKLWRELVGTQDTRTMPMKVTNVSLGFTGLEMAEMGQKSIEGFLRGGSSSGLKRLRGGNDNGLQSGAGFSTGSGDAIAESGSSTSIAFTCMRCGERVTWVPNDYKHEGRAEALAVLRIEHDDFHFAQDLAKMPEGKHSPEKKKRKKEPQGIAKFFQQK
jgi:DNA polymerase eta